jgi:hypothetical protein
MYIKDRMRVRDSSGKEFDIEMDLKVEIQPARPEIQQRSDADPNDEVLISSTFYDQLFSKLLCSSGGIHMKRNTFSALF